MADPLQTLLSPSEAVTLFIVLTAVVILGLSSLMAGGALLVRHRRSRAAEAEGSRREAWRSRLRDVLYGDDDPEALAASVPEEVTLAFLDFLVLYARRLDGEERARVTAVAAPHLGAVADALDDPAEGRRMTAVQTLGELGLPEHADAVVTALDDPSPVVAMVAATTLAGARTPAYTPEILSRLPRFSHWRQDFLASMLAGMGPGAAPALRAGLADTEAEAKARSVAADALAELDDPAAADVAAEVLASRPGPELEAACLRVLARVGRGQHLTAVRQRLEASHLGVRLAAVRALGQLGTDDDLDTLAEKARSDPSPWVAIAAARGLKGSGGDAALEALAGSDHPRAALGLQVTNEVTSW